MTVAAAAGKVLGGHLVHAVVFGGWALAVLVVVLWPHETAERRQHKAGLGLVPTADRTWLQVAALGLFAAAATHGAVMPDHFRQSWLYGAFFLGAASSQLTTGVLLLGHPSPRLVRAALAGSVAIIVLWTVSRFVGVPIGPDNGGTEPVGVLDVVATVAELVTAAGAWAVLRSGTFRPAWRWTWWAPTTRLIALAVAAGVPVTAVLAPKG